MPDLPVVIGRGPPDEVQPVGHSRVTMTQLMAPQDTNLFGSVFGGVILALVDKIAYVSATRHAGCPCTTVSFDQVDFNSPIQIGEIVTLEANVATVGRTSIGVGVRVFAEDVQGGLRRETNVCFVTMVASTVSIWRESSDGKRGTNWSVAGTRDASRPGASRLGRPGSRSQGFRPGLQQGDETVEDERGREHRRRLKSDLTSRHLRDYAKQHRDDQRGHQQPDQ
jgi:acyl-CoA hydrolase